MLSTTQNRNSVQRLVFIPNIEYLVNFKDFKYTQNLKDLANSNKPLCPADISPMRGDFEKSRTKKPPF